MRYKTYDELCSAVGKIDPDAEKYMRTDAKNLEYFAGKNDSAAIHTISNVFSWGRTPQGHKYWKNIHNKMKGE